jgi:hypothetical protein
MAKVIRVKDSSRKDTTNTIIEGKLLHIQLGVSSKSIEETNKRMRRFDRGDKLDKLRKENESITMFSKD